VSLADLIASATAPRLASFALGWPGGHGASPWAEGGPVPTPAASSPTRVYSRWWSTPEPLHQGDEPAANPVGRPWGRQRPQRRCS